MVKNKPLSTKNFDKSIKKMKKLGRKITKGMSGPSKINELLFVFRLKTMNILTFFLLGLLIGSIIKITFILSFLFAGYLVGALVDTIKR